jgi:hypothetical protein
MVGFVSFGRFSLGTKMRTIALLVSLCALSGVASAQTEQQCPPTPRTGDLLNCYNGTTPPRALSKPKASKGATAADQPAAIRGPIDKPVDRVALRGVAGGGTPRSPARAGQISWR